MRSLTRKAVFALIGTLVFIFLVSTLNSGSRHTWFPHSEGSSTRDYWDWDTSTRFRTPHAKQSHIADVDICDSFPTDRLASVQVVLKIGGSEDPERLDVLTSTVTRCITNLLIVSDREAVLNGHRVHDVLADLPPSFRAKAPDFDQYEALQRDDGSFERAAGWRLDRYKFLPMVEYAKLSNPSAQWFVFLESDTYFFWDNLFRLLDQFDPDVPLYFGSPSPGHRAKRGEVSWFAYGGVGFVLSRAAVDKLVHRPVGSSGEFKLPSLTLQDEQLVTRECCGDSVLGWTLFKKGIKLSGLFPMFNPHPLHGIPFDESFWCQPVISLHKTSLTDMAGLTKWENSRDRTNPLLYSDLFEYTRMGELADKEDWDNGEWGGFQDPLESPAHRSFEACRSACHDHDHCLSFTYDSTGHCVFVPTMRLGLKKLVSPEIRLSAGWDNEKINSWTASHQCPRPHWVKPSIKRIF
ncbi:hypothetical protein N7474_007528 [Penicillium riverlandense]|uniref:uncharacterized protein n=1 Tax=Penicillium riverlandense TaxID=1903569 RepID=UPI0025480CAB|nr:uncharacterized protein N7474_007528 [Penicillium riverlandense]KAJ5815751.1 hypothetical protein N7474_007528 [Penicillium riverlandense]